MSRPAPSGSPWVVLPRPNPGARLRLFCFPYAGGGASVFTGWPAALPADVEVCAVQPPGREGRIAEAPFSALDPLVEALGRALEPFMDRPFAFFGHSNGGLMGFELSRELRREGRRMPVHLFTSGRPAPQLPLDEPPISGLPPEAFIAELRRYNGTPEKILQNREIMELLAPVLRADFALGETYAYRPEPPLEIPISAYGGQTDAEVDPAEIEAWREQTSGPFHLRMFPGGHFFLIDDRDLVLAELARELRGVVARAAAGV